MIQRRDESFQWMLSRGEKIDHLALGVGPGIGAAGAPDPGLLASEQGYRFLQLPLNRRMICLKLESVARRFRFLTRLLSFELYVLLSKNYLWFKY